MAELVVVSGTVVSDPVSPGSIVSGTAVPGSAVPGVTVVAGEAATGGSSEVRGRGQGSERGRSRKGP